MSSARSLLLALLAVGCAVPAGAPVEGDHPHEHGAGTQSLAGFAGGSSAEGSRHGATFGLDYGYRIGDRWGVGAFAEVVTGLDRSLALGLQAFVNPVGGLVIVAGPGGELHHDEWGVIGRVGGLYEFPVGDDWILAPSIYYDITEHTDLVIYGVTTGFMW